MNVSKPIVFFGTEDFSLVALKELVNAGFPIAAVVTKPDAPKGRGQQIGPPMVKVFAEEHSIPVWQPLKLSEIKEQLLLLDSPVGVLVSYGKIIPQSILDLFSPGIINLHPSLLPKYRGPSPIESVILSGDRETGVSIMKLSAAMDAGPIYEQEKIVLNGDETAENLYEKLGSLGSKLLITLLPSIIDGTFVPKEQNDDEATYCHIIKKSDGVINWTKKAEEIEAQIRAYHLWPQCRTTLGNSEIIITQAEVLNDRYGNAGNVKLHSDNTLTVDTGTTALRITHLKPLGKKEMPIQAFLAGYRHQIGL